MKTKNIKQHFLIPFLLILIVFGLTIALFCFYLIKNEVIQRAQRQVVQKLKTVRLYSQNELDVLKDSLALVADRYETNEIIEKLDLDYCEIVSIEGSNLDFSRNVSDASAGVPCSGIRIIPSHEIVSYGLDPYLYKIDIQSTPKAIPTDKKSITNVMALEVAVPLFDRSNNVSKIVYGGKILNKNFSFIDRIKDLVFEGHQFHGRPYGTVTIFQDDTRIATNVMTLENDRAIGTRVSEEVYRKVVTEGQSWIDRAFVVNDWYLTAYEPIKDRDGNIIGILYVGILEKPFIELGLHFFGAFLAVFLCIVIVAFILIYLLSDIILRPLFNMIETIDTISKGDLSGRVTIQSEIKELNHLAHAFNEMANILSERQHTLEDTNSTLAKLNQNYIDLIGFVAHELKGVIGSTLMSAYTVRDGFLGEITKPQKKSLDLVIRNLDYLTSTIRSFLNLNTIEKGELTIDPAPFFLKEDVIDVSMNIFKPSADNKSIRFQNRMRPGIKVNADRDLIQIVSNNLIGNAIKYGDKNGTVSVRARVIPDKGKVEIEVYNDSIPLTEEDTKKLFKKFSRVLKDPSKKVKGTGLGLYISREIIERHSFSLWHEARTGGMFLNLNYHWQNSTNLFYH
jgi:two-component system NtrC family sensor kinase